MTTVRGTRLSAALADASWSRGKQVGGAVGTQVPVVGGRAPSRPRPNWTVAAGGEAVAAAAGASAGVVASSSARRPPAAAPAHSGGCVWVIARSLSSPSLHCRLAARALRRARGCASRGPAGRLTRAGPALADKRFAQQDGAGCKLRCGRFPGDRDATIMVVLSGRRRCTPARCSAVDRPRSGTSAGLAGLSRGRPRRRALCTWCTIASAPDGPAGGSTLAGGAPRDAPLLLQEGSTMPAPHGDRGSERRAAGPQALLEQSAAGAA